MSCLNLVALPTLRHSRNKPLRLVVLPRTRKNDINIFDVDIDVDGYETQLLLADHYPNGLVRPQEFPLLRGIHLSEAVIVSQSSRSESRYGPLSASKAHFCTMSLPLNVSLLPAKLNHVALPLNSDVGPVASGVSGKKLPASEVEAICSSRKKRPEIETEILAGPESFNEKLLK
jgi:hypothetical protein